MAAGNMDSAKDFAANVLPLTKAKEEDKKPDAKSALKKISSSLMILVSASMFTMA